MNKEALTRKVINEIRRVAEGRDPFDKHLTMANLWLLLEALDWKGEKDGRSN